MTGNGPWWNDGMSTDVEINCDLLISELLLVVLFTSIIYDFDFDFD